MSTSAARAAHKMIQEASSSSRGLRPISAFNLSCVNFPSFRNFATNRSSRSRSAASSLSTCFYRDSRAGIIHYHVVTFGTKRKGGVMKCGKERLTGKRIWNFSAPDSQSPRHPPTRPDLARRGDRRGASLHRCRGTGSLRGRLRDRHLEHVDRDPRRLLLRVAGVEE